MRYAFLILIALVLAVPFVVRRALAPNEGDEFKGSSAERLVVITPHNQDIRREFARAFGEWHRIHYGRAVALDLLTPGGTSDIKRQLDSTYRNRSEGHFSADISVVWGGGDYFVDQELKPLGILQPIHFTPEMAAEFRRAFPQPALAGVKLYDATAAPDGTPTPLWIGVCLSSFGICYNPDVYRALGLPDPSPEHGWSNLTDPKLAGFVAMADPAHAGSSAVAYQMVIQRKMAEAETLVFARNPELRELAKAALSENAEYRAAIAGGWKAGMAELLKIAANTRYFTDSSTIVPMDVSRGEAAAGMSIDFYARVTEESAGPDRIRYFAPVGVTAVTPDPVAILAGTQGRALELANHFIEFLLSPQGQRLWILKAHTPGGPIDRSLRRMPIRHDLYADQTDWADHGDPLLTAGGFNQRGAWMTLFSDTRPIWVAAWIDGRDALRDAYAAILAVHDPARRRRLIDRLADIPIEMSDVGDLRAERKRLEESHGDLDLWRANEQIEWAKTFRRHYRRVQREAQANEG
ncbi:MAG TPA: extracellular solute-binding protein [Tepidisphaeraceae bacterium]|jgi:ABC-type Fe3+ transport system substrate-binding protein|nr:extracellular solute-binding protein [Tepidisphaeraceae bacterium]